MEPIVTYDHLLTHRNITMSLNFCPCKIPIPYDASYVYDACNVLVKSYSKSIVATTHCIVLVKSTTDIAANARPLRAWFCHTSVYRFTRAKTFAVTRQIRHTFACVSCYCATFRLHFNHARRGRALATISGKVPSVSGVWAQYYTSQFIDSTLTSLQG